MSAPPDQPPHGGRGDPSRAIATKKKQAEVNRGRISAAITSLQKSNTPVTVAAVARASGVSDDTIRRNRDLFEEIRRIREGNLGRAKSTISSRESATIKGLRARLTDARSEIRELRREVAIARAAAHQELGLSGHVMTPKEIEDLRAEHSHLAVSLESARSELRQLRDERDELADELTAAHELNREYARRLTAAETEAQRARTEAGAARKTVAAPQPQSSD